MSASESHSDLVLELAEEFLERYRQGQRPSLKEYIDRYPELAAEIKEVFPAMALMENVALADESLVGEVAGSPTATGAVPQQLGDYRLLREVGRGGMGIVYEAEQVSLGRHVAVKLLPRKVFLDFRQRQRFEREARAAAKLHHTNIVPVFGVGEHDGMPYYVMQFIQGLGLDDVLDELKRMQDRGTSPHPSALPRGREEGEEGKEPRVSRKDVSAAEVAHSLVTDDFQGPIERIESLELGVADPLSEGASALSESQATSDTPHLGESAGTSGKLSDSFSLSSSVRLPGSGGVVSGGKARKGGYWQSVARIGVQVAEALEYAHKQGIQHRDIKPSNLLLDTRGTVWVTDFGLARAENEDHLTQTGDIVGTLRYLPPEAFEGLADKRGDIYSLGLTLYELLALQPAFAEKDRNRLIKRVTTEEPARLDKLNRAIPRDLVTIVHKAIDREPARRYSTAGELAADLQRFLEDEPIQARRVSSLERLARLCRHHPGVAALTAALVLILVGLSVASLIAATYYDQLRKQAERLYDKANQTAAKESDARQAAEEAKNAAEEAKKREAAQRQRTETALYYSRIALAERAWQANDVGTTEQLLDQAVQDRNPRERRDWEWRYLKSLCHADLLTLTGHRDGCQPYSVAYSPDGRFLASAGRNYYPSVQSQQIPSDIIIWDAGSGQRLRSLDSSAAAWPSAIAYSRDGSYLAVLSGKEKAKPYKVWDTRSWSEVAHTGVKDVVFHSPAPFDAQIDQGAIRLNEASGEILEKQRGPIGMIHGVDKDRQGRRLASVGTDHTIRIWDVEKGVLSALFRGHTNAVDSVVFSPDGSRLASASADGTIKIWDLGRDPRGVRLQATAGKWGEYLATFAFTGDGQRIHTLDCGGPVAPRVQTLDTTAGLLLDEQNLSSLNVNLQEAAHHSTFVHLSAAFALSPTGERVAGPRREEAKVLSVCDRVTGRELTVLRGHAGAIRASTFSPDGRLLATASPTSGEVKLWDATTGKEVVRLAQPDQGPPFRAFALAFSPDGKRLAAGPWATDSRSGIWVWDVANGQRLAVFQPQMTFAFYLTFSPDGSKLAAVGNDGEGRKVQVLDAATGQLLFAASGSSSLAGAAFSPDGRRLAAADLEGQVFLWDADSGHLVLVLPHFSGNPPGHYGFVARVAFSPDGRCLAANNWDGTISLWTAEDLTEAGRAARLQSAEKRAFGSWLADLNKQLTDHPKDPRLYLERGRLFVRRGRPKEAEADFTQAIQCDPESADPWYERGRLFAERGDYQKADADFAQAEQRNLDDPQVWEQIGSMHLEREQWDKAMVEFTQAVRLQPAIDPRVRFRHGYLVLRCGDRAGYRQACRDLLQLYRQSKDPHPLNWTVRTCILDEGAVADPSQLVQMARKALAAVPGHSGILFVLAAAHYRAGQFKDAIQQSEEALKTTIRRDGDDRILSWLVLAMAHQRLGQTDTARRWLKESEHWLQEHGKVDIKEIDAWHNQLIAQRLYRETQTLIEGKNSEPKK